MIIIHSDYPDHTEPTSAPIGSPIVARLKAPHDLFRHVPINLTIFAKSSPASKLPRASYRPLPRFSYMLFGAGPLTMENTRSSIVGHDGRFRWLPLICVACGVFVQCRARSRAVAKMPYWATLTSYLRRRCMQASASLLATGEERRRPRAAVTIPPYFHSDTRKSRHNVVRNCWLIDLIPKGAI